MSSDDMRKRLLDLRDELSARRERIRAHERAGVPADFEEQAKAREDDEVVQALGTQIDAELALIARALARVERGDYGTCTGCGEPIASARLEALPYAEQCTACAG